MEAPCFSVENAGEVKANYLTGEAAVGFETKNGTLYAVSGAPTVSRRILAELADRSGVHRYLRTDDAVVYAGDKAIGIYHITDNDTVLYPKKSTVYTDVFSGEKYETNYGKIGILRNNGRCKLLIEDE